MNYEHVFVTQQLQIITNVITFSYTYARDIKELLIVVSILEHDVRSTAVVLFSFECQFLNVPLAVIY